MQAGAEGGGAGWVVGRGSWVVGVGGWEGKRLAQRLQGDASTRGVPTCRPHVLATRRPRAGHAGAAGRTAPAQLAKGEQPAPDGEVDPVLLVRAHDGLDGGGDPRRLPPRRGEKGPLHLKVGRPGGLGLLERHVLQPPPAEPAKGAEGEAEEKVGVGEDDSDDPAAHHARTRHPASAAAPEGRGTASRGR